MRKFAVLFIAAGGLVAGCGSSDKPAPTLKAPAPTAA